MNLFLFWPKGALVSVEVPTLVSVLKGVAQIGRKETQQNYPKCRGYKGFVGFCCDLERIRKSNKFRSKQSIFVFMSDEPFSLFV